MPIKIKDEFMVGKVFTRLTVLSRDGDGDYWLCECTCGSVTVKSGKSIRGGITKSCGCLKKEVKPPTVKTTHGMTKTVTYVAWKNMKARCDDINHQSYYNYGGRGVKYQSSWVDFESFLEDMGECPEGLTLDRINVLEDYTAENCTWTDNSTQAIHRRKQSRDCSSKYKGVSYSKNDGKYKGYLMHKGKGYHLGYSSDPKVLAEKYDELLESLTGSDEGTNSKLGYLD